MRSIYFSGDQFQSDIPVAQFTAIIEQGQGLLWVSLEHPTPDEVNQVLGEQFHFHPLAIEDCQSTGYQTPKLDDFGDYLFIIAHALAPNDTFEDLPTNELNIFLGKNYIVSFFNAESMPPVDALWQRLPKDERLHQFGADFLCHALLDDMVDDYLPYLDRLEEEIDELENLVAERPHPDTLARILELKHYTISFRRVIAPQREVINRLSRDEFPVIDNQSRIYFRDVYDHLVRINDLVDMIRDMAASALDVYLNSTSLRLNEVMKALTIVSTIFLPLSFLAGVYGMNFQHMPELAWNWGYPLVWVVFIFIVIGMLAFFKKKGWF